MGCAGCSVGSSGVAGCGSSGGSCGCSRMSVYNWLADVPEPSYKTLTPVEVSFKNGARKDFFKLETHRDILTGDIVVVEAEHGYDMGRISLSGELVKLQMKKKKNTTPIYDLKRVIRKANDNDLKKIEEIRILEKSTLVRSRVIARKLGLEMKLGDIEYQGNGRKATFFYTADGRVDFRQLIKDLAAEFKVKIEMRQIGLRQESARVGGIGSCGRELCCSTWLNDFSSVTTSAARYQNLSINQAKLSGQCGRLKCCLNYELDTYLDAWNDIPKRADRIETEEGTARLIKTDILRKMMHYKYDKGQTIYKLEAKKVQEILALKADGKKPQNLFGLAVQEVEEDDFEEEDLVGQITLDSLTKKKKGGRRKGSNRNRNRNRNQKSGKGQRSNNQKGQGNKPQGQNDQKQQGPKNQEITKIETAIEIGIEEKGIPAGKNRSKTEQMKLKTILFLLAGSSLLVLSSCREKAAYVRFEDIAESNWSYTDTLNYTIELENKPVSGALELVIRNTDDYPFQNLWLDVIHIQDSVQVDSLRQEIILADLAGRWLGKKGGAIYSSYEPITLEQGLTGKNELKITQVMRKNPLNGIQSVGVKVK